MRARTAHYWGQLLVDPCDEHLLSKYTLMLRKRPSGWVRVDAITQRDERGTKRTGLARLIMNARSDQVVDHINGDGFDNRRSNLRLCSTAENSRNRQRNVGQRFKGIYLWRGRWIVHIGGDRRYVGTYWDEIEAARAYDQAARIYFGEFAALNFPREGEVSAHNRAPDRVEAA